MAASVFTFFCFFLLFSSIHGQFSSSFEDQPRPATWQDLQTSIKDIIGTADSGNKREKCNELKRLVKSACGSVKQKKSVNELQIHEFAESSVAKMPSAVGDFMKNYLTSALYEFLSCNA
jgi:hypothetical protein